MGRTAFRELVTGRLLSAQPSREGDRVTNVELFFDLVYVFAFTQVTSLMTEGYASGHGALAVAQGLGVLGTIWWSWTSYAWLANQSHADRGLIRITIMLATALMFVVSLAIPESFDHEPGQWFAPTVFVTGIAIVTLLHATVYLIAAGDDRALRRQIVRSIGTVSFPTFALLIIGAILGGTAQAFLWLAAPIVEGVLVYATSNNGDWRINSLAHFTERHGLVVMLALGESVVAIGTGLAIGRGGGSQVPLNWPILIGATISVVLVLAMWWSYFDQLADRTEHVLAARPPAERVAPTSDAFTYLHLPLVAGIIVAAVGIETAMHEVSDGGELGMFGAIALGSGLALYLAMTAFVWLRVSGQWSLVRFAAATLCLALVPLLAGLPALAALALLALAVVALGVVEKTLGPHARVRGIQPRPSDAARA